MVAGTAHLTRPSPRQKGKGQAHPEQRVITGGLFTQRVQRTQDAAEPCRRRASTRPREPTGPVTTSLARPEDIARIQAIARGKRKQFDTTVYDDPRGLTPVPKLADTTETRPSMTLNEAEGFVRSQERKTKLRQKRGAVS